jgi:hypothetical protein
MTLPLRFFVLHVPLYVTLTVWLMIHFIQIIYRGPLTQLVQSLALQHQDQDEVGLYLARDPEITYYNRQCHLDDISTHDANDLLIHDHYTQRQRKDIMMTHGAVIMPNILSHNTTVKLREYLEQRHDDYVKYHTLPWNELFWDGDYGSRLSLGIGPEDDPIIAQALHEVGHHQQLAETLTAIVGPNPALVEVSTLTTMHGAEHQNIHTDSDYFGSSVLYARTFLHSYTMFIALQYTTAKMGATTLCPGTHFCANEDLEGVCMATTTDENESPPIRNSFEASSNGHTGIDSGAMLPGDAMMFNQNVWHRGPQNNDPERPYNRIMFILTFVSQRDLDRGDVRQQGWGTYFYMRHSMWGQAFEDLKGVLRGGMSLPLRYLKAYGLYSTPTSGNGRAMPWLEHWARQMANNMDFFSPNELPAFHNMLQTLHYFPKQLLGDPTLEDWNEYLLQVIGNAVTWIDRIYFWVLSCYLAIHLGGYVVLLSTTHKQLDGSSTPNVWRNTVAYVLHLALGHLLLLGVFVMTYIFIMRKSPLFRRIGSGDVFRKPFPILDGVTLYEHLQDHITTVPDRMDILLGSRFDAPYLASMNDMLEYHPGNQEWNRLIRDTVGFPLETIASQILVDQVVSSIQPLQGVARERDTTRTANGRQSITQEIGDILEGSLGRFTVWTFTRYCDGPGMDPSNSQFMDGYKIVPRNW